MPSQSANHFSYRYRITFESIIAAIIDAMTTHRSASLVANDEVKRGNINNRDCPTTLGIQASKRVESLRRRFQTETVIPYLAGRSVFPHTFPYLFHRLIKSPIHGMRFAY